MLMSKPDQDNSLPKLNSQVILDCVELTVKTKPAQCMKSASSFKQTHTCMYPQMNMYIHIHESMPENMLFSFPTGKYKQCLHLCYAFFCEHSTLSTQPFTHDPRKTGLEHPCV